ncbi:CorA family divalent cation transporter [Acinetobacter sp. Marseille-Q1618]|uniref:CorA family divalent cation transporter n=1 Tax=Acinetobacter sp. Marseille-Q1618 TaxID=2697502 RepID=UPI00156E0F83|nr:CorA family divalent cation transporter [Acinetobacter sp. Marseille-Q1618]
MNVLDAIKCLTFWQRLSAQEMEDFIYLKQQFAIDFKPKNFAQNNKTLCIRCVRIENQKILLTDLLWYVAEDAQPIYTVENKYRVIRPAQALERMQFQQLHLDSSHSIAFVFLNQLLGQAIHIIDYIDQNVSENVTFIRNFQLNPNNQYAAGVEDLSRVDTDLNQLSSLLGHVLNTVNDLELATRQLKYQVLQRSQLDMHYVEDLMSEIEATKRRIQFLIERQRFHWSVAGECVSRSNLNITKVFSVLWAAFIPGVALINWYGQNFRVMPELSWNGTMPVQLITVLLLTAIPIWMVKNAGSLR